MPMKNIYVSEGDLDVWAEAVKLASDHNMSISKLILSELKSTLRERRGDIGIPLGFPIPASMKDPRIARAESFADQIRAQVLDELLEEREA